MTYDKDYIENKTEYFDKKRKSWENRVTDVGIEDWHCPARIWYPLEYQMYGLNKDVIKSGDRIYSEDVDNIINAALLIKGGHVEYDVDKQTLPNGNIVVYVDEIFDGTPFTIVDGMEIFEDEKKDICKWASNYYNMLADIYEHPENRFYISDEDWDEKLGHSLEWEADLHRTHWRINNYPDIETPERRLAMANHCRQMAEKKLKFSPISKGARTSWLSAYFKKC